MDVQIYLNAADGMGVLTGVEHIEKCKNLLGKRIRKLNAIRKYVCTITLLFAKRCSREIILELEKIEFGPRVPIISNFAALPTSDIDEIKDNLINQLCETVRWKTLIFLVSNLNITVLIPEKQ